MDIWTIIEDLNVPTRGGQHGDRSEDIGDVDQERLEDEHV
jgi:hypothetical protein